MIPLSLTVSLVPEAKGGPFILWDDLETSCAKARALGYHGIELFAPSAEAVKDAAPVIRGHGLNLTAIGTGAGWVRHKLTLTDPAPENRARARRFILDMIKVGRSVGDVPAILGSMQGRVTRPEHREWILDALREFDEDVAKHNGWFLLEPLNRYEGNFVNTLAQGVEITRGLSRTWLLADCFHMAIEEDNLAAAIVSAGSRIAHVQVADSNRRPIGHGHTDWPSVVAALRSIGYTGALSAEALPWPDPDTAARLAIEGIRKYFGA